MLFSPLNTAEFDAATKDLDQEWVGAQPNDWGFVIGAEDFPNSSSMILEFSLFSLVFFFLL